MKINSARHQHDTERTQNRAEFNTIMIMITITIIIMVMVTIMTIIMIMINIYNS